MSNVIDWDQAMEQCGEDEEFLRELLADLKGEVDTQIINIEGVFQVSNLESLGTGYSSAEVWIHVYEFCSMLALSEKETFATHQRHE